MRDLERIEERSSDEGRGVLMLSGVGLLVAIGVVVAAAAALPDAEEPASNDPLQLVIPSEVEVDEAPEKPAPDPDINPEALSFPTTLVTDDRPEVAAAMAAAAAELAHLDPLTDPPPPRSDIAAGLPAAVTAGPDRKVVEMAAVRDPLVAATVPDRTRPAAPGREGRYTLQVISYREPKEAHVFASGLRKRGHAAYVTTGTVEGRGKHWRVRIGPFESRQEAQRYRTNFERDEGMNTFIIRNKD